MLPSPNHGFYRVRWNRPDPGICVLHETFDKNHAPPGRCVKQARVSYNLAAACVPYDKTRYRTRPSLPPSRAAAPHYGFYRRKRARQADCTILLFVFTRGRTGARFVSNVSYETLVPARLPPWPGFILYDKNRCLVMWAAILLDVSFVSRTYILFFYV